MNNLCRSVIFFCATIALTMQHSVASEDDAVAQYSERAVELLRDAISRETAHGQGLVPAYAESLQQVLLEAGFSPEALTVVPYGETASLVVRYEGDGSSGREPILFSSHMDVVPADPEQTREALHWAADYVGPVFLRIGRHKVRSVSGGRLVVDWLAGCCVLVEKNSCLWVTGLD